MLSLQKHHIVDLYCWIDDLVPKKILAIGGRPTALSDSELITMLIWNALVLHQRTIKDMFRFAKTHLANDFPNISKYGAFLKHCHRVTPLMFALLERILSSSEPIRIMDSTMLPVCKLERADNHKVAQGIADFGKNHQGWHFGFKLHASVSLKGKLCGIALTPASVYDAQVIPKILNKKTKIAVGDSHYGASVMGMKIWKKYGTFIISPPHYKQTKKIATPWQVRLLNIRPKIESVFDVLKEHMNLVSSFPRSVFGYLVHYIRILLGYQIMALCEE